MIYEARPNVTADAGALCFKSGNGVILRGGKEALQTSMAIAGLLQQVLREHDLPEALISVIQDPDTAPVELRVLDFVWVAVLAVLLCTLAAYLPARAAARIEPIRTIRFGG